MLNQSATSALLIDDESDAPANLRADSERFVRSVLDSLVAHIAVVDRSGRILAVNRAWREFAAANGAIGAHVSEGADYFQACSRATGDGLASALVFVCGIRDVLEGARDSFDLVYPCHAPNRLRWFVGRVTPFHGGRTRAVVVAHVEITERKLTEDALRRTEQRFRMLVESSSDIVTVLSADGTVIYQSPSIERVLGHRVEDRLGATSCAGRWSTRRTWARSAPSSTRRGDSRVCL